MRLFELLEVTGKLRTTDRMFQQARDAKCQTIVAMDPMDFLTLTTVDQNHLDDIKKEALPLHKYNRFAKLGQDREYRDFLAWISGEKDYGATVHPFLSIGFDNAKRARVAGHEGRHRAAALLAKGGKEMPVALCMRPSEDMLPDVHFGVEYHLNFSYLPNMIKAQFTDNFVSTGNWKIIQDDIGEPYRR